MCYIYIYLYIYIYIYIYINIYIYVNILFSPNFYPSETGRMSTLSEVTAN